MPSWFRSKKKAAVKLEAVSAISSPSASDSVESSHNENDQKKPAEATAIHQELSHHRFQEVNSAHVPELIVILENGSDRRDVVKRLKRRGFTVPILAEDFCALFVGAKLAEKIAMELEIATDDEGKSFLLSLSPPPILFSFHDTG